jgi:endonuclease I
MPSYDDVRYMLDDTDKDPNNPNNVILVYLGTSVDSTWDFGATWNREHVWPQSLLGVDAGGTNAASDLHNLKPADPNTNSSRGNKYFDNTTTAESYAPRDEVKGDIARILFYMEVMYDIYTLINGTPTVYQMAMLDTLISWHDIDPVDDFESNRNDIIFGFQGNRNPFIDYPEFYTLIYDQRFNNE